MQSSRRHRVAECDILICLLLHLQTPPCSPGANARVHVCGCVCVCVCRYISITQLFRSLLLPVSQQNVACSATLHGMSSALVAAHETFADFPDVVYLWHASHYLGLDTTIDVTSSNVSCSWNTASYLVDNAMTHVYA